MQPCISVLLGLAAVTACVACSEDEPGPPPRSQPSGGTLDDLSDLDPPPTARRQELDAGRYAIEFPVRLRWEHREGSDSTRYEARGSHDGKAYALVYFVHEAPAATIEDRDYLRFETTRFVAAMHGRDEVIEEVELPEERSALSVRFVSTPAERDVHHAVVAFVADRTMFFVHVTARDPPGDAALELARSFEVLRSRPEVVEIPEGADAHEMAMARLQANLTPPPRATEEVRAATPRSTRPGEASVANSCNQIALMGSCYETAVSSVGRAFFSNLEECPAPHVFREEPCPVEGRTASCVLSGGFRHLPPAAQVVHFYRGTDSAALCSTYEGSHRPASPRVLPRNAP